MLSIRSLSRLPKMALAMLSVLLVATGCTPTHMGQHLHQVAEVARVIDRQQVQRQAQWRLPADTAIYVAVPDNLPADAGDAPVLLQRLSVQALRRDFVRVTGADEPQDLAVALHWARRDGAAITLYPNLLDTDKPQRDWRALDLAAPGFQPKNRQVLVAWLLLDTASGQVLDRVVTSNISPWWPKPAEAERLLGPALAAASAALVVRAQRGAG